MHRAIAIGSIWPFYHRKLRDQSQLIPRLVRRAHSHHPGGKRHPLRFRSLARAVRTCTTSSYVVDLGLHCAVVVGCRPVKVDTIVRFDGPGTLYFLSENQ